MQRFKLKPINRHRRINKTINKRGFMNTLLIMNLFLYAKSPQAGAGAGAGMSVETEKFQTIERCETAKKAFMNMRVSDKALGA